MKYYPMSIWYYLSLIESAVYLCMFRSCLLRLLARPLFFAPAVSWMKLRRDKYGASKILELTFNDWKHVKTNVLQGLVWKPMPFQQFRHVAAIFDTRNSSNPETSLVTMHPLIMSPLNLCRSSVQAFAPQLRHLRVCIAVLMASRIYGTPCPPPPLETRVPCGLELSRKMEV